MSTGHRTLEEKATRSATLNGDSAKRRRTRRQQGRTLGPVSDLERHLPADWWRTLFNAVYLRTDSDVVENDVNTTAEVDLLTRAAGLEPNDRIIDLCCGQGRHCLELAKRGFGHVTGIDRSRYLIRLARKRARERQLTVAFQEGDARKFRTTESSINCVAILGNSFGYFDRQEDDVSVLQAVKRALCSGGTLALDIVDGEWIAENFEPRSWEWIDQNQLVCRERSPSVDRKRMISREVVIHAERGVIVDQFYAERLYTKEGIEQLLVDAGFQGIRFHGTLQASSTRDADLGMMAHRMFLTARAPQKDPPRRRAERRISKVTVILGDPSLPDEVKRDGQFNTEDLDTVERLKRALDELDGYEFTYFDNHGTLLPTFRADPPEFVLNFCDEGFQNDAFKELHVPALLELLDIPYSGAGPASLGFCYNKSLVRAYAQVWDIPVPAETFFTPDDQSATIPAVFPALVKPNYGDSSIGITKDAVVRCPEELISYLDQLRDDWPGRPILVQEFLNGSEYSVGIVGNPGLGLQFLPILEVDYSRLPGDLPAILGYESKWIPDSPYWTDVSYREAEVGTDLSRNLYDWSALLFERLGCRDYARFDFRADADGQVKLLEVNPNPGWCWDGKFNIMAGFDGLRYADLLRLILEAAQKRVMAERERVHVRKTATAAR